MVLRVCLSISILAGAGVIALSHLKVRPRVQEIINQRENYAREREAEKMAKNKALNNLRATAAKLQERETAFNESQSQLASAKNQAQAEATRANGVVQKLAKSEAELHESQQKLSRWDGLGVDPVQAKALIASAKNLRANNDVLDARINTTLAENVRLHKVLGEVGVEEPILPAGLKGKVLTVDPKWNFVVLDVGEKQGALKNGVLMISRNTKLVAKVKIASLEGERSIANIIPGWDLAEVREGDQALY